MEAEAEAEVGDDDNDEGAEGGDDLCPMRPGSKVFAAANDASRSAAAPISIFSVARKFSTT